MASQTKLQNNARKSAEKYFAKADHGESLIKNLRKKERAAEAANTARLRGLRLAKEAADKAAAADKLALGSKMPNAGAHAELKRQQDVFNCPEVLSHDK